MFFKQFSKITDIDSDTINTFDSWLIALPKHLQKNITISGASARTGIDYAIVSKLLSFACTEGVLSKHFLVVCPHCNSVLQSIGKDEIVDALNHEQECDECGTVNITTDNIVNAYELIEHPNVTDSDLSSIVQKHIDSDNTNFLPADSLSNCLHDLYEAFYNPDESAYNYFSILRNNLDMDYGTNTTLKGNALEKLVLEIFSSIKYVSGTNKIKTNTNQFDCTFICGLKPCMPTIFDYLTPYFVVECKNEKKKPDNTYINKLASILSRNEAKLGIIVGRHDATDPCFTISREHYLISKSTTRPQVIITLSDEDLSRIIDDRVNLLLFLQYKILRVTTGAPNAQYEYFYNTPENAIRC